MVLLEEYNETESRVLLRSTGGLDGLGLPEDLLIVI